MSSPTLPTLPTKLGSPAEASGGIDTLLGGETTPKPRVDLQEALRASMGMFRDLNTQIESLAGQHPEAAKDFRAAQNFLRRAMMTVTQKLTRGQEAAAPNVAA